MINKTCLIICFIMLGFVLVACGVSRAELMTTVTTAPSQPTQTPFPPTATQQPTATEIPTATAVPTATPIPPLALLEDGASGWCLRAGEANIQDVSAEEKPKNAFDINVVENEVNLVGQFHTCYLFFKFNQAIPDGLHLDFYDKSAAIWYTSPLVPMTSDPSTGAVLVNHTYAVDPPAWSIIYHVEIVSEYGLLYASPYAFDRGWRPDLCWNDALPNPTTLTCPMYQDLHPWDIGYGIY